MHRGRFSIGTSDTAKDFKAFKSRAMAIREHASSKEDAQEDVQEGAENKPKIG